MHDRLVSRRIDALHQCFLVLFYVFGFQRHSFRFLQHNVERAVDQKSLSIIILLVMALNTTRSQYSCL